MGIIICRKEKRSWANKIKIAASIILKPLYLHEKVDYINTYQQNKQKIGWDTEPVCFTRKLHSYHPPNPSKTARGRDRTKGRGKHMNNRSQNGAGGGS